LNVINELITSRTLCEIHGRNHCLTEVTIHRIVTKFETISSIIDHLHVIETSVALRILPLFKRVLLFKGAPNMSKLDRSYSRHQTKP